jgi:hypothetical protein
MDFDEFVANAVDFGPTVEIHLDVDGVFDSGLGA